MPPHQHQLNMHRPDKLMLQRTVQQRSTAVKQQGLLSSVAHQCHTHGPEHTWVQSYTSSCSVGPSGVLISVKVSERLVRIELNPLNVELLWLPPGRARALVLL